MAQQPGGDPASGGGAPCRSTPHCARKKKTQWEVGPCPRPCSQASERDGGRARATGAHTPSFRRPARPSRSPGPAAQVRTPAPPALSREPSPNPLPSGGRGLRAPPHRHKKAASRPRRVFFFLRLRLPIASRTPAHPPRPAQALSTPVVTAPESAEPDPTPPGVRWGVDHGQDPGRAPPLPSVAPLNRRWPPPPLSPLSPSPTPASAPPCRPETRRSLTRVPE